MTTFSYSGNDWNGVINRAVRGRPECKFTRCESLQLRLQSKRNDLQRLEDLTNQLEGEAENAKRAIRDNVLAAIIDAASALAILGSLLLALRRFRSVIQSTRRLLDKRNINKGDLARIFAELGALIPAVSAIINTTRAFESSRILDKVKGRAENLAQDAQRVHSEIYDIANELDRDCFSPTRNLG